MDQGLALLLNPPQTFNLDIPNNSLRAQITHHSTQLPAGETSQATIKTINAASEPAPQEDRPKKRRRTTTRDQRVERQIVDSLHFKDPTKYQEWLNTAAYNKRGPLTQKQDEWLWGFTGADYFGKVDWAKCAHLYFQLFDEKRTAGRLQMEWFRISRNKENESGYVANAQEKRKALSNHDVVTPKSNWPVRNARKQSAAVNVTISPKNTADTQVADPTRRRTGKRRLETLDDERQFCGGDRNYHSKRSLFRPKTVDYNWQEPLPVRMKPIETLDIREIISCTAATKLTKPLASLEPNDDHSLHNNAGISLDTQDTSARYLAHNRSRGGCSSVATDGSFENQTIIQASHMSTGTVLENACLAPSNRVPSSGVEYTSNETCDLLEDQRTVRQYFREVYVSRKLRERGMRQVESTVHMGHYWQHNPHTLSTVAQITNHISSWARGETDAPETTISAQELPLEPVHSAEEVIVRCETIERLRQELELVSNIGLLLDPELISILPLLKEPLNHTGAVARNQLSQQVSTGNQVAGYQQTQNAVIGTSLTNPSQTYTRLSSFEKSLGRILQILLDTPINQDIVIVTESDYIIWSVTTSYPAQQASSEPESEGNSTSTKELIRKVRAIIRRRGIAGSKTEFE